MATQTIPISLTAGPVPAGFTAANIDQLLQAVATYISAEIRADVSFYLEVVNDPTEYETTLIFNTTQQAWKAWSIAAGRYVTITQNELGDIKQSVSDLDQVANGWVVLNGRTIAAVPGLSPLQITNLTTMFGATLPVIVPLNGDDVPEQIVPANGVIAAIDFSGTYDESKVEALRDRTEELRDSTAGLLASLTTTPVLSSLVFCGYP